MNILVLNGSPRIDGNTSAMVAAFVEGAGENGHHITVVPVCKKTSLVILLVSIAIPTEMANVFRMMICRIYTLSWMKRK